MSIFFFCKKLSFDLQNDMMDLDITRMELLMGIIRTNKLQVGMKLGEAIYRNDQIILSENVPLTLRHIQVIKQLGLEQVKIVDEKKTFVPVNKYQEKYKESVESFKNICHTVTLGNMLLYDEVEDCLEPLIQELESNPDVALKLWQIHTSDYYTYEHSVKVCMLSILLSKWMNKPQVFIDEIAKVGLLHDIGKCNIPNEILNKPDTLTSEEFGVMKTHATLGFVLLNNAKVLSRDVLKGVLHHHERYDGTGYPAKLLGKHIPEYARIVSIVDVFDAMTSNRVYREKMNPFRVLEIMATGSPGAFDPEMAFVFIKRIQEAYIGEKVLLNTGLIAEVHDVTDQPSRPVIRVNNEIIDLRHDLQTEIKSLII